MIPDLYWVAGPWKGRLAISARPRGDDWLEDEVKGWRSAQIEVVVSLLEGSEERDLGLEREEQLAEDAGLRFVSFPISDRGVPASVSATVQLFEELRTDLDEGRTVAVHCRQGIGRSALIAAGLLVTSGEEASEALAVVSKARGVDVPETAAQRAWVEGLLTEFLALARR